MEMQKVTPSGYSSDTPIIPSKVVELGNDNRFIIGIQEHVKTTRQGFPVNDLGETIYSYWILDTSGPKSYGPMTKDEFDSKRNELQVPKELTMTNPLSYFNKKWVSSVRPEPFYKTTRKMAGFVSYNIREFFYSYRSGRPLYDKKIKPAYKVPPLQRLMGEMPEKHAWMLTEYLLHTHTTIQTTMLLKSYSFL